MNDIFDSIPTRTVHTVSELNQMVRSLLEDAFPPIWIEGEISNFSCPSSGHWYFSLKDNSAQVRCAMFQGKNRNLNFLPKNGMKVIVRANISLYEARGEFQLIADMMEEAGDGALRRAFDELKNKLAQEGLFATDHKKPLPKFINTVGVVTSPTGAAVRDIIIVLKRRYPAMNIIIYPTAVQGTGSGMQIAKAISMANQRRECDLLIVGRGGGSLEDLWAFNEEVVARTIYASEIPIVSAVGHEIDFTIADFVADVRAATPSAAAELISPDSIELLQHLHNKQQILLQRILAFIKLHQYGTESLVKRLRHPGQRLQEQSQRIDEMEQRLCRAMKVNLQHRQHQLEKLIRAIHAVSPLATLARGYAIVTSTTSHAIIRSSKQVNVGDKITAQLAEGMLECEVNKIL